LSTLAAKKKGLESLVDPAQRILQNLTVNRTNVLSNAFDVGELLGLLYVVDADQASRRSCKAALYSSRHTSRVACNFSRCRRLG
jgi:hypothetical protein